MSEERLREKETLRTKPKTCLCVLQQYYPALVNMDIIISTITTTTIKQVHLLTAYWETASTHHKYIISFYCTDSL